MCKKKKQITKTCEYHKQRKKKNRCSQEERIPEGMYYLVTAHRKILTMHLLFGCYLRAECGSADGT